MSGFVASFAAAAALLAPQQTGAVVADPEGGPSWAVRFSTRPSADPSDELECIQAGRLEAGRLFRLWSDGSRRELGADDRTVCGAIPFTVPVIVERLVDDPKAAEPRLTRTIVAGMAPDGGSITLTVAGQARQIPVDPVTRTFLAVLPGTTKRSELKLQIPGADAVDMTGRDDETTSGVYDEGSARRIATLPDPAGGRPIGLVTHTKTIRTVSGPERLRCSEAGRMIGDEAGAYEPGWGSFLEAPTLVNLIEPEDAWAPVGTVGPACDITYREQTSLVRDYSVMRLSPTHVVIHGFLAPGARVRLRAPVTFDAAQRSFVAIVPSTGARGEVLRLSVTGRRGKRERKLVHLGPYEWPHAMHSAEPRENGRVLRVRWIAGFEPLAAVSVRSGSRRIVLEVSELAPRNFSDNGTPIGIRAIALSKCVDIRLPGRLGSRRVVDGVSGKVLRRPRDRDSARCARAAANRSYDPPIELPR